MQRRYRLRVGFTLIEILVVVTIISIMAGTAIFFAMQGSQTSRDAKRQSDLRTLQAAVEQYKLENGRYPEGCNGPNNWSGEPGTAFECSGGNSRYISNLAPKYIPRLPRDPRRSVCPDPGDKCGYAYLTNSDGTSYKIVARNTVESERVDYNHPFKSCDVMPNVNTGLPSSGDIRVSGICGRVDGGTTYPHLSTTNNHACNINDDPANAQLNFSRTYGVWGGYAKLEDGRGSGQWCIDLNSPDPLRNFVKCSAGSQNLTAGLQNSILVRAVANTHSIICK